jgi:hypothetical protein
MEMISYAVGKSVCSDESRLRMTSKPNPVKVNLSREWENYQRALTLKIVTFSKSIIHSINFNPETDAASINYITYALLPQVRGSVPTLQLVYFAATAENEYIFNKVWDSNDYRISQEHI